MSDSWTTPGQDPQGGGSGGDGAPPPPPPGSAPPPPPDARWSSDAPGGWAPPPPPPPPGRGAGAHGGRLIPLRPLRVGEVLDGAFTLLRANPVQLLLLTLLTVGLFSLLQGLVTPTGASLGDPARGGDVLDDMTAALFGIGLLVSLFVTLVISPAVTGALTYMAMASDRGEDASWQAGLRFGLRNFWRLLGTSVLAGLVAFVVGIAAVVVAVLAVVAAAQLSTVLAVVLGLLFFVVVLALLLVLAALLYVAIPVVVVEGARPTEALRRSYRLLRPQLLRTVGIVLLAGLIVGIVSGVAGFAALPFQFVDEVAGRIATGLVNAAVAALTVPFSAFIALLVYVDARVRQEGLDVAVLTSELDRP